MITMRKSTHGFPFHSHDKYGAPLGGPPGRRSSAINLPLVMPDDDENFGGSSGLDQF